MSRILLKSVVAVLIVAALVYVADFVVWHIRDACGFGTGSVQVTRFVVAPLKGGKEEYYPDGTETVSCSESVFPQTGSGACWWLRRHRVVYDR